MADESKPMFLRRILILGHVTRVISAFYVGIHKMENEVTILYHSMNRCLTCLCLEMAMAPEWVIDPFTAGAAYILVFIFYYHIKYHLLNMLKI